MGQKHQIASSPLSQRSEAVRQAYMWPTVLLPGTLSRLCQGQKETVVGMWGQAPNFTLINLPGLEALLGIYPGISL